MTEDVKAVETDHDALAEFVKANGGGEGVILVVRPTSMTVPAEHYDRVPIVQVAHLDDGGGWQGHWCFSGKPWTKVPGVHQTRADATTDAYRRAMASIDPEAEGDEFEDDVATDAFDHAIHYASLFIDDENRYRGRWYRGQWDGEGAYTDLLYDTQGQARRAARRLRATGDES